MYLYGNKRISSVTVPKPKPLFPKNVKSVMENTMEKIANKYTSISIFTFLLQLFRVVIDVLNTFEPFWSFKTPLKQKSNFQWPKNWGRSTNVFNKIISLLTFPYFSKMPPCPLWKYGCYCAFDINVLPKNVHIQDSVVNKFTKFHNFVVSAGYLV